MEFASRIYAERKKSKYKIPLRSETHRFTDELLGILFPHYSSKSYVSEHELNADITLLQAKLQKLLTPFCAGTGLEYTDKVNQFFELLPVIYDKLLLDAIAIEQGDPAAGSVDEVIIAYPGFFAIAAYRIAHSFYMLEIPLFPRLISEYAHQLTGIDINPGATIGKSFFIDHGTGIVIGESTIIGNNVKLYQGVTLGALSVDKKFSKKKRHPTIEDDVIIYSNATILGGKTVIGKGSVIGGNVWLTESVAPNSIVYHKSEIHTKPLNNSNEPINFSI